MNIAITGGLGTGKSTVGKIFASALGSEYIDTDQICRQQMESGAQGFRQFIDQFGEGFLLSDGSLDRTLLRHSVFTDAKVKVGLENILHPLVQQEVAGRCLTSDALSKDIVVEVPLLYEVGWQDEFDITVVVYVSETVCLQRVTARDGLSAREIKQVLAAQLPLEEKRGRADFIVDNSGTFASTTQQVSWVLKNLRSAESVKLVKRTVKNLNHLP